MNDNYNLNRFIEAQEGVYPIALKELQEGRKRSHWMWYIFPQLEHLGYSYNAKFYGISGIEEATAYLEHPILGQRLREISKTLLSLSCSNAVALLGATDAMKLRSSMTLFNIVSPNDVFARVLCKFFNEEKDNYTISILKLSTN